MNVALVDKHPIFRTGVRATLMGRIENLTTFETGGIHLLSEKQRPSLDIVILGLSEEQPEIDRKALKKAMKSYASASFIVCPSKPDNAQVRALLRAGVKGIVTKACCPDEVLRRVIDVFKGKKYICLQLRPIKS